MTAIHETAYPRIKPNLTHREMVRLFTLTEDEVQFIHANTKKTRHIAKLGLAVILKCFQYLGRPIKPQRINPVIISHIAKCLNLDSLSDLSSYPSTTRRNHIDKVREYLGINTDIKERRKYVKNSALFAAETKENLADIINYIIEEIIKLKFELPGYTQLLRIARAARKVKNYNYYHHLVADLSQDQKDKLDDLLHAEPNDNDNREISSWIRLKQHLEKPTLKKVRRYLQHLEKLCTLRGEFSIDIHRISPMRIDSLNDEAMAADASMMQQMNETKRYALMVILIHNKTAKAIDELIHAFINWNKKLHSQAKHKLERHRIDSAPNTDELMRLLYNMLLGLKNNESKQEKLTAIEAIVGKKLDIAIEQCKAHLKYENDNYYEFMLEPFANKRNTIYCILEALSIKSSTTDKSIEQALKFIKAHKNTHEEWLDMTDQNQAIPIELGILTEKWHQKATDKNKGEVVEKVHRKYYELGVLSALETDLSCADAYVEGSFYFDDPNKHLISWSQFNEDVESFCKELGFPVTSTLFVELFKNRLKDKAKSVDNNFPSNPYLSIENNKPILKKAPTKENPENLDKIREMMMAEMPFKNIVEVIADVENWLNISKFFKPLSGYESKIKDYPSRFTSTSFSYGCNVGPTQGQRCLQKYTRKQIAWLFNHHITEQKIDKAIYELINRYNLFTLPGKWGDGSSASVDGTFWDMYTQNLLAAHHIRYGKYGGVGYYHISDKYIALFSNLISCGAHEAAYLLDFIVENDSDIKPTKIHGDSWAQSEVLFGLSAFFNVDVMPRIKNFKHLYFYKASKNDRYFHIDDLFTEKQIDWELIEKYYDDMLRIAMSIKAGTIKASTILRKLCSKSRKNKLYYAFRELGRVRRTLFLLKYIDDLECRRLIQAGTCKSEEFNEFKNWVAFGGGGVIGDNMECNQRKILKYNHLVANMVIFHNVVYQTKAINKLIARGINVPDEILKHLSPYWTEHLNRYGIFLLDLGVRPADIEYDLNHLETVEHGTELASVLV